MATIPNELPRRALAPRDTQAPTTPNVVLVGMSVPDLLALRGRIDEMLPARELKDVNLERELVLQFLVTQQLQNTVLAEEETPANQRAQVVNACAAILQTLTKLQEEVFKSERVKRLDAAVIGMLQEVPVEMRAALFAKYEEALNDLN